MFKRMFLNKNIWISNKMSLKYVPWVLIDNMSALVQTIVWRRPGDKPLSEPVLTHITNACGTRGRWVLNWFFYLQSWKLKDTLSICVDVHGQKRTDLPSRVTATCQVTINGFTWAVMRRHITGPGRLIQCQVVFTCRAWFSRHGYKRTICVHTLIFVSLICSYISYTYNLKLCWN